MKKITFLCIAFFCFAFCWQVNAQFTESFDTEIPATWTILNEDGGSETWNHQTQYPYAGAGHARVRYESAAHNDFLITPQFTVTANTSDRISFFAGIDGTFWTETFDVRISTTGTAAADFTTIASETATTDADGDYTQYTYDLSAYVGSSVYVAIVATDTNRLYLFVDEFVNDGLPNCTTAEVASADPEEDCANSQFDIVVEFTTVGDATGVSDGTNTYPIVGTTATLDGNYADGSTVSLTVVHSDPACDFPLDDVTYSCPVPGETCEDAIVVGSLPYTTTDNTSNYGDDYGSSDDPCSNSGYLTGDDVVYSYTPASDITVDIATSGTGTWVGLFVYEECPFVTCVDNDVQSGGNPTLPGVSLTGGTTYYIVISTFPSPQSTDYTLEITELNCTAAEVASADPVEDCANSQFDIVVEFTTVGDATGVSDGTNTYPIVGTTATLDGNYAFGTDVTLTVVHSDSDCDFELGTYNVDGCPPVNDDIVGAIKLETGDTVCEDAVIGTNVAASTSAEGGASCGSAAAGDVWFEIEIPSTGELTVETSSNGGITDTVMAIYSGTSGSLVEVDCDDDGGDGAFSSIELTGYTPGDTFYVRVWEYGNNDFGTFSICAWSPTTLSVETSLAEAAFSYYPNPVSSTLTLKAQTNINNITVHNMLGQEVLRTAPNTLTSELDMSGLQTGAYFVKVSIGNSTKTVRIIKN